MRSVLVLMTALVPTSGHRALIEFAASIEFADVYVLINCRSHEPIVGADRVKSLLTELSEYDNIHFVVDDDDNAPQNPDDHPQFWEWWRDKINSVFRKTESNWAFVVASEPYGQQVADVLGARFLPYDIGRELTPVVGTTVRHNLLNHWDQILRPTRQQLMLTATLFGQESVGKSATARALHELPSGHSIFEYARPYLETVGTAVTATAMEEIRLGQTALQKQARAQARQPLLFQDTDLFSTIGYHRIIGTEPPAALIDDALDLASDVYYLLPDNIPFVGDALRYGGNVRESSLEFWRQLLEEYDLEYVTVVGKTIVERARFVYDDAQARFHHKNQAITQFRR